MAVAKVSEINATSTKSFEDAMQQGLARALKHHDTIEYWKSAPYLLGFMEHYALKTDLKQWATEGYLHEQVTLWRSPPASRQVSEE